MASWANVLKAPSAPVAEAPPPSGDPTTIAVVDANAIINGVRVERIATTVMTIPEVLEEIKDKQSRQFLATLPFGIECREPSEESVKAGEPRVAAAKLWRCSSLYPPYTLLPPSHPAIPLAHAVWKWPPN